MNDTLEMQVGALLKARGLSVALAESCTGGLIAHWLTNVSGSSDYVKGGVVSYSNEAKQKLLGVRAETLATQGAVSRQCALEMARGARGAFGSDIALSVTGIAGPGGGSADKPVGLTFIGLAAADHEQVERFVWQRDRVGNKEESARAALDMLKHYLERK